MIRLNLRRNVLKLSFDILKAMGPPYLQWHWKFFWGEGGCFCVQNSCGVVVALERHNLESHPYGINDDST